MGELEQRVVTLLLDGWMGGGRRMGVLGRRLEGMGVGEVEVFGYDNSGRVGLRELGGRFAERVRWWEGRGYVVNAVGHSMGGLVVRSSRLVDGELPLRRVVTLNSPHLGTWVARGVPRAWLPGVGEMRVGSAYLEELAGVKWGVRTMAVWTVGDLIVVPNGSAAWGEAEVVVRSWVPGHIWALYSPWIHRRVGEFLMGVGDGGTGGKC